MNMDYNSDTLVSTDMNTLLGETVKTQFSVTFNIILSHVFPESFIVIPQVVQNL